MSIQPKLKTFDLAMIVLSLVIGIGIFRSPAEVAHHSGNSTIFFLAWITGGIISLLGALTYAEIGSRFSVPGGFYQLFSIAYHPMIALMLNWALLLTMGASFAMVALIGSRYLLAGIAPPQFQHPPYPQLMAAAVMLVLGALNWAGIRVGSRTQNLLSGLKILLMALIIIAAFSISPETPSISNRLSVPQSDNGLMAFGISLIAVFFSFGGYHQSINFGGDVQNAQRNLPRAILLGICMIVGLYLLINFAFLQVLGFERLQHSDLVAADTMEGLFGPAGRTFASLTIFLSALGFLNATLLSTPRMYYAMAEDRVLPPIFGRVNSKTQVQEFGLLFYLVISLISLAVFQDFRSILEYVMFIDSMALALGAASIFIFRHRAKGQIYNGFKTPLYPLIPALYVICLLAVCINVGVSNPKMAIIGVGLLAMGAAMYLGIKRYYQA
ncbi:MAG: amino acid permease [Bacteroidota bacterium]